MVCWHSERARTCVSLCVECLGLYPFISALSIDVNPKEKYTKHYPPKTTNYMLVTNTIRYTTHTTHPPYRYRIDTMDICNTYYVYINCI